MKSCYLDIWCAFFAKQNQTTFIRDQYCHLAADDGSPTKLQIIDKEIMPWQEDESWKIKGSYPGAGKGFFPHKNCIKIFFNNDFV